MKFRYPLDFNGITMEYGATTPPYYSEKEPHKGLDFGWHSYQGEPVYSIGKGTVIEVGYNSVVGNYCKIQHDNNYVSRYLHFKSTAIVKKGQVVEAGQQIGNMGNTGSSNGTHLHLDIKLNGTYIDPKQVCYLYQDQKCSSADKGKIKTIDEYPNLLVINSDVGLWMLDKNGKSIEVYPNKTIVQYIDYGYYKYGYHYYKVRIYDTNVIGYMASEYLDKYIPKEIPQNKPVEEIKEDTGINIPTEPETIEETEKPNKKSIFKLIAEFINKIISLFKSRK